MRQWLLDFLDWVFTPYSYYLYVDARIKAWEERDRERARFYKEQFKEQCRRGLRRFEQRLKEARK